MNSVCYVASTVANGISTRAKNALKNIPCAIVVILTIPATAIGLAATPFAAITFGKVKLFYSLARYSHCSRLILPVIFTVAMEILNPNCKISSHDRLEGTLQKRITLKAIAKLLELTKTNNTFFNREIGSRLFAAILIPTAVVAKFVDGALAVPAVAISVITFGCIPKVNQFAYDNLKSFSSIPESISEVLILTFNPHLRTPPKQNRD